MVLIWELLSSHGHSLSNEIHRSIGLWAPQVEEIDFLETELAI